jgi:hypothetical protein
MAGAGEPMVASEPAEPAAPPAGADAAIIRAYLLGRPTPCPRCGYNLEGCDGTVCPECAGELAFRENAIRCSGRQTREERDMSVVALGMGILLADLGAGAVVLGSFLGITPGVWLFGGLAVVTVLTGFLVWLRLNTGWFLRQPAGWRAVLALLGWSWMIVPLMGWFMYVVSQVLAALA